MYLNTVGTFGIGSALGRLSQYLAAIDTSRGTCSLPTTITWRPLAVIIDQPSLSSSSSVPPLVWPSLGTRPRKGTLYPGWGSSCHTASSSSESHSAARNGSPGRLGTCRRQNFFDMARFEEGFGRDVCFGRSRPRATLSRTPTQVSHDPSSRIGAPRPRLILSYLFRQTRDSTHCACAEELARMTSAPRVDAQGVSHAPGLVAGSHMLVRMVGVDVSRSRWYSHEITRSEWPWCSPKMTSSRCSSQRLTPSAVLAALNCSTRTPRTSSVSVSRSSRRGRTTGERNCAQPAHVHQVSFFRGHHGACSLHEEGLDQGARGAVAPVRQRGGRLAGQWELRRVQPKPTLPTWTGCFSRKLSRSDVQLNRISRMRKPGSTSESRYENKGSAGLRSA